MRKIIITGSSGLIGSEVTSFFNKTDKVIECDLSLGHDVNNEDFVKKFFRKNKAEYLINLFALNHHIENSGGDKLFDVSLESFDTYLKVNLTALFSVCREFAKNNTKGSIVNFSSTYGCGSPIPSMYVDGEKHIGYGVSKAGVIQMTKHLATHLAPDIRVNSITPGGVKFKQDKDFIKRYSDHTPMKRMMNVNELNGLLNFLCSEESSYMTGENVKVDGGWTAW